MKTTHHLTVSCICPVDKLPDTYEVTIETPTTIMVESIIEVAKSFSDTAMYQEQVTGEMARRLCAKVTSIGYHSGIKTVVEA